MKNYTAGWAKAIAATNARLSADPNAPAASEPTSASEHPKVVAVRKRCEEIVGACVAAGMSEHAPVYFEDPRDLDQILKEIKSAHLVTDYASHLGLKSEFRLKAN